MISLLASIPSPPQNTIDIGPLTIHFYGILIAIGVIVAVIVARLRYERFGGDGSLVERVSVWAVLVGFLGARAGYVLTHTGRFEGRPWAVLFIWEGGLALYGGLLFGALTIIYLMNRWRGDLFSMGDAVAVGIPLAQAIGRWGNYFNQELFGTPTDLPWGLEIALENRPEAYLEYETFHPTFLYEALWNAFILVPIVLILERRGRLFKGASFPLYLILYAAIRFAMELLRTDTTFRVFGISRNGWVSVLAMIVGIVMFWWMQKRREPRRLVGKQRLLAPGPKHSTAASIVGEDDDVPADDDENDGDRDEEDENGGDEDDDEQAPVSDPSAAGDGGEA